MRTAIKLGLKVVSYDVDGRTTQEREAGQARNLYRKVFAKNPDAKLFVHAGYAHIDKAKGRLGNTVPMAMQLQQLTGIEPLSIDHKQIPSEADACTEPVRNFPSRRPLVLLDLTTGNAHVGHSRQNPVRAGHHDQQALSHWRNSMAPGRHPR